MTKYFTLYICILFITNVCVAQSYKIDSTTVIDFKVDKNDSIHNVIYPIGLQYLNRVTEIECCILDSIQIPDSTQIKDILNSFHQLCERISMSKIEECSDSQILYSFQGYEFLFAVAYNEEHIFEIPLPDYSFARLKLFGSQDKWRDDFITQYNGVCATWKFENLLIVNFDQWDLGHSYNRHSGITYYMMKK